MLHKIKWILVYVLFLLISSIYVYKYQESQTPISDKNHNFVDYSQMIIADMMAIYHIPSIQIAIIEDGHIVSNYQMGVVNVNDEVEVTQDTLYRAQSLTKTITSTLIAILIEQQHISLDDPLEMFLPDEVLLEIPQYLKDKTIYQLLTHQSGLHIGNYEKVYDAWENDLPILISSILDDVNMKPTGESFSYSNVGYHILEYIIEEVTQKDYHQVAHELIFSSSAMNQSSFYYESNQIYAYGHDLNGHAVNHYQYAEKGSGGLLTTANDYANFLIRLINGELISEENMSILYEDTVKDLGFYSHVYDGYGLGVFVEKIDNHILLSHGGQGKGFMSYYQIDMDSKSGFVLLSNSQRAYPLIALLATSWNAYADMDDPGISLILNAIKLVKFLNMLLIFVGIYIVISIMRKKWIKHKAIQSISLLLSIVILVFSIIGNAHKFQVIYVFIPLEYERIMLTLLVLSLISYVYVLISILQIQTKRNQEGG
ncbi:MAG: serine hydrolase domain-containing protein [Acholeplasmataceae bacterium]|jgi:CubicO group peptidase (beta-lactamase class C family)|nr:serine hydrolase domain-containing protein [Acholeplasmataceae bacterium]